jgi:hypothetical protein
METALFIIIIVVLFILGVIVLPQFMLRRAIKQVIALFRKYSATSTGSAKQLTDLGIKPNSMFSFNFGLRDYKFYAVQALMKHEIVMQLEDGRLYLVEDKLLRAQ